jgi:pseudouridine kinase
MKTTPILCIGGAAVDRKFRTFSEPKTGTSNPASASLTFGGVARNVAETIARLGGRAALVSAVGNDGDGRELIAALRDVGVDARGVAILPGEVTAQYIAVLGPDGGLHTAVMDMGILERRYGEVLARGTSAAAALPPDAWIFGDCNAPAAHLADLIAWAQHTGRWLALDTISVAKAARLPQDLTGIGCLFLNADEACAVTQCKDEPEVLAAELIARGAARVVLTLGAEGAVCIEAGAAAVRSPAELAAVVDVTGAGDSMIAGVLVVLSRGLPLDRAVAFGAQVAAATVASPLSVSPLLTPGWAAARLAAIHAETAT